MRRPKIYFLSVLLFWTGGPLLAQSPKYELRGVWVSTVANLDWPQRGASPAQQQTQLLMLFDAVKGVRCNAVFLQVRPESDAFFPGTEPWSYYLTGKQGQAPQPAWDPLAFAIEQAHRRGLELHAWINPFRVVSNVTSTYPKAPQHLSLAKPEWMLRVKNVLLLDPGIPAARQYLIELLTELVERYPMDGLHFDDYFYPYEGITTEDNATYQAYGAGKALAAWREDNINQFVEQLSTAVLTQRPELKYGISPFGIWKNGVPAGITGLSGAEVTGGNALTWLSNRWIDYLAPQLYWRIGGNQDFAKLSAWWQSQMNGRHLYPGLGAYRAEPSFGSSSNYQAAELPRQLALLRQQNIPGAIFFRAANLTTFATQGLADSLRQRWYRQPALPPIMEWKSNLAPEPPQNLLVQVQGQQTMLRWNAGPQTSNRAPTRFFGIYRVSGRTEPDWAKEVASGANLVACIGGSNWTDPSPANGATVWYAITSISPNSIESAPVAAAITTAVASGTPSGLQLALPFPNPFREEQALRVQLPHSGRVTLRLVNALGQEWARPWSHQQLEAGWHTLTWLPPPHLPTGLYWWLLEGDFPTQVRAVVHQ